MLGRRYGVQGAIRLSCLVSASLVLIAWPAAASAATVKVSGPWLLYEAAPGEVNDLTISKDHRKHAFTVSDGGAGLTPGAGCSRKSSHVVKCHSTGVSRILAKADDLDDSLVNDTRIRSRLDGGDGKDRVVGGHRADTLYGGDDEDRVAGRGGHDTVRTGGRWADAVRCGSGRDVVFADWLDAVARNCESVERPAEG